MTADLPLDESEYRRWRVEAEHALGAAGAQRDACFHNRACLEPSKPHSSQRRRSCTASGVAPVVELGGLLSDLGFEPSERVEQALCARLGGRATHWFATR